MPHYMALFEFSWRVHSKLVNNPEGVCQAVGGLVQKSSCRLEGFFYGTTLDGWVLFEALDDETAAQAGRPRTGAREGWGLGDVVVLFEAPDDGYAQEVVYDITSTGTVVYERTVKLYAVEEKMRVSQRAQELGFRDILGRMEVG